MGLPWFKHYNTASQGNTLRFLWDGGHYDAIAFWWLLLELVSRWEHPEKRGKITVSWKLLARETGWLVPRVKRVLGQVMTASCTNSSSTQHMTLVPVGDELIQLMVPNWLELQENRGGKNSAKNEQKSLRREKEEVRSKIKDIRGEKEESELSLPLANDPPTPIKETFHKLVEIWNENCGSLSKVKGTSKSRDGKMKERWKECSDPEYWGSVVKKLSQSPFCNGSNDRGWKATFDFLIQPDTQNKALEGKYDSVASLGQQNFASKKAAAVQSHNDDQMARIMRGEL